jgi:hypothetical protein
MVKASSFPPLARSAAGFLVPTFKRFYHGGPLTTVDNAVMILV